jgi:acyl carrier protein
LSVVERIRDVFRNVFGNDELVVSDDTTSRDIPAWDSLANINLMFSLEQEFHIRFRDDQMASFRNVGELRRFLEESGG